MATYLVEFFTPRHSNADATLATRLAAARLAARVISVPDDETVFWLVEAESDLTLDRLLREAGVDPERIAKAFEHTIPGEEQS